MFRRSGRAVSAREVGESGWGFVARLARLVTGTILIGVAIAAVVRARAGMLPLNVLHTAVSHHTGWTLGGAIIATQATLLVAHAAWGIRPGVGTVIAAVVPAVVCDLALAWTTAPASWWWRAALLVLGTIAFAAGVALYLSAALGALPRDGLMAELHRRRPWLRPRAIRVVTDLAFLSTGWLLLGLQDAVSTGVVGIGSLLLSLALGPMIERLGALMGNSDSPSLAGDSTQSDKSTHQRRARRAEPDAEQPAEPTMPRAHRMAALRALVEGTDEPQLSLWPGLLPHPPMSTVVGPAGPTAMSIESFLDFARCHGVRIVYGAYVDDGSDDDLVALHHGLVLQYPVAGGVVHCWTAVRGTPSSDHDGPRRSTKTAPDRSPTRRGAHHGVPPADAPGGPTGAVTALNHATFLRLAR